MSDSLVERLRAITANSFIAREAADEIERLQEEARRWYHADGNSELLSTTEECVKRRIGAAAVIDDAAGLLHDAQSLIAALAGSEDVDPQMLQWVRELKAWRVKTKASE